MISSFIILVLMTLAPSNFYKARAGTRETICLNNLRQIEAAADRWVFEKSVCEGTIVIAGEEEAIRSYL